ncbi:MAG: sn-glycerol-1-phosphate dehydrogenase [Lentisphaerae bacterium]|nr:sn-glycerol-1-phosphate dehydrogenase [Lentisphaerota bacterium]
MNGQILLLKYGAIDSLKSRTASVSITVTMNSQEESWKETKTFISGPGTLARVPSVLREHFPEVPVIVIADDNTWEAAGEKVDACLNAEGVATLEPLVFPGKPILHSDYEHVAKINKTLQGNDIIPVSVGSGTINDLVKRAAFESERRYLCVATAVSVDGYSSFGAAILRDGVKMTMDCPAPVAIVADTDVLKRAPYPMTAAGYADLASKITAGADWIVADFIGVDPIDTEAWKMVQKDLRLWLNSPAELKAGESEPFEKVFLGLTMSGLSMQYLRKSRPASGSEHLFSHIWEMENLEKNGEPVSHGFKVAIGTLMGTALAETIFAHDAADIDADEAVAKYPDWATREKQIRDRFGDTPISKSMTDECRAKHLAPTDLSIRIAFLKDNWDALRSKTLERLYPYAELCDRFKAADVPVRPEQINLTRERVCDTIVSAQMMRNRYTILDLAFELGWIEDCRNEILKSDLYLY